MAEQMSLEVFDPLKAAITELQEKDKAQVFDHTTEEGEKNLRSWVHRVRGCKGDIEKVRKATKADALAFGRKVDEIARELTIVPEKIIATRMKPLDEIEAKKRAAAEAKIEAERVAAEKAEAERLADLERREAETAKKEAELQAKEDAIKAEQEEKKRAEREKQIAIDAAEKERKDAERIAANRAKVAEQEKAEAIEAEKEKARQAERDRVAKAGLEIAEQTRLAEKERKRVENVKHRKEVEQGVIDAIVIMLGSESDSDAQEIVDAIVSGEIPNVEIIY